MQKHKTSRTAHALVWAVAALAGAAVGTRVVWVHLFHGALVPVAVSAGDQHSAASVLVRAGLDAKSLAAAGVSSQDVAEIVTAAGEEAAEQAAALASADAAGRSAKQSVDRLTRIVQSGTASPEQVAQLSAARSTLATARANQQAALDAVFAAGVSELGESQHRIAEAIRANRSWGLPIQLLASNPQHLTEAQWVALRDAVSCQDACARLGEDVPSGVTAAIAAAEAVSDVASAKSSYQANAASVASAWNQAVAGG